MPGWDGPKRPDDGHRGREDQQSRRSRGEVGRCATRAKVPIMRRHRSEGLSPPGGAAGVPIIQSRWSRPPGSRQ